jgi:dihydrofolate reductase
MKCTVYIATSLDGFIARKDGAIDWLPHSGPAGEDYGYAEFIRTVDAIVMGRNTFDLVRTFPSWPYSRPVIVLTTRPESLPEVLPPAVRVLAGSPPSVVQALADEGAKHLYVDGGVTIQRFLRAGLITRVIITRIPVLLGSGLPLFGDLPHDVHLEHVSTRAYPNGLVQSEYLVAA